MAVVNKTVRTTGGDYSTMAAWDAADGGGDGLGNDDCTGSMYDDTAFDETLVFNFSANSSILTVAVGERHDGTAGTGVRNVATAARVLRIDAASGQPKSVKWIEWDLNGNGSSRSIYLPGLGGGDADADRTVQNIIVHGNPGAGSTAGGFDHVYDGPVYLLNSIFYNLDHPFDNSVPVIKLADVDHIGKLLNVTVHGCALTKSSSTANFSGIAYDAGSAGDIQNVIVTDIEIDDGSGTAACFGALNNTGNEDHNLSSDATAAGTGSLINEAAADIYTSTVGGSEDLRQKAGSPAINVGVDLGTTPTNVNIDILGRDRDAEGDVWDMSAHEFVSGISIPIFDYHYRSMRRAA